MRANRIVFFSVLLLSVTGAFNNCGKAPGPGGTSTGNPVAAAMRFKPFTASGTSGIKMCFKRLRFKASGSIDRDVDLYLGEVSILAGGTDLGDIDIPTGRFRRIEFDLDDDCFGGKSLTVTNSNGTYSTSDGISIRFEGDITISYSTQGLALMIQEIIDALANVNSNSQLRNAAESVEGEFELD